MARIRALLGSMLAVVSPLACGSTEPEHPRLVSFSVSPSPPVVLQQGDSVQLSVTPLDNTGHLFAGVSITFSVADTTLIAVSNVGEVRSLGPLGVTTLTVAGGGVDTTLAVLIVRPAVTLELIPDTASMLLADTIRLTAVVRDFAGVPIPGFPVNFQVLPANRGTVDADGLVHSAWIPGGLLIRATAGHLESLATLTVHDSVHIERLALSGNPVGVSTFQDIALISRAVADEVQRLNLATGTFTDSIGVGSLPAFSVFNAAGTRAYVAMQGDASVSVIDVAANAPLDSIPLRGAPIPVALSGDGSRLFVTTDANYLYKIRLAGKVIEDSLALPATSHHLLMHPNDSLLYVATRDGGSVLEVTWRTMTIARTLPLGGETQAMAISPDRKELYVSNAAGYLQVVTLATGAHTNIPLAGPAQGLALGAEGTRLYVGILTGQVQIVDRATHAILSTLNTGGTPRNFAVDAPRNRVIYVNESGWVDILP
jgi:YVTN family beta-propeller protein